MNAELALSLIPGAVLTEQVTPRFLVGAAMRRDMATGQFSAVPITMRPEATPTPVLPFLLPTKLPTGLMKLGPLRFAVVSSVTRLVIIRKVDMATARKPIKPPCA